jgi:hypothetical protein
MKIIFEPTEQKYLMNAIEYQSIWDSYQIPILSAFESNLLPFQEKLIKGLVGDYPSNYAGISIDEPMLFRFSVRHKLGTIFHELSHRIMLNYKIDYSKFLKNDHEFIDLFLYDIMKDIVGDVAAQFRVDYELTFPEEEIPNAWRFISTMSERKRKNLLNQILKSNLILRSDFQAIVGLESQFNNTLTKMEVQDEAI